MIQQLETPATENAVRGALMMDALVGRLSYDDAFATALANNPRETLEAAGLVMDKETVEAFITVDPDRFDKACEALFNLVDSDFLHGVIGPSCEATD